MSWSKKYKRSIDCDNPQGFSQKAHCDGRKKRQSGDETKSKSPFTESNEVTTYTKFTHKTKHLSKSQHQLDPNLDLKHLVHHSVHQYVDRDADGDIDVYDNPKKGTPDESPESAPVGAEVASRKLIAKQKGEIKHTRRGMAYEETEPSGGRGDNKSSGDNAVGELETGLKKLDDTSYDSIDKLMRRIMKKHDMTAKQLHNAFVNKNGKTPDDWIKSKSISESRRDNKRSGDPDYSLRDWFKGGGWIQVAGKYKGKPCAKQPGQKTKPFCRDADDAAAMTTAEKKRRTAKKRKEDPNPNRKGKAKMVREETCPICNCDPCQCLEGTLQEKKDACYHKVKSRYKVWPSAYASGALVKCRKVGADSWGTKSESTNALAYDWDGPIFENEKRYCPKCQKMEKMKECRYGPKYWSMFSIPYEPTNQEKFSIAQVHPANEEKDHEYSMARSELSTIISAAKRLKKKMKGEGEIEAWVQSKITKAADYIDTAADYIESGESKNESVSIEDANGKHYAEFIDIIKPEPLKPTKGIGSQLVGEGISPTIPGGQSPYKYPTLPKEDPDNVPIRLIKGKEPKLPLAKKETKTQIAHYEPEGELIDEAGKKCWPGYKKKGTQELFGKKYNRCVKEGYSNWREELGLTEDWQKVNRQDKTDGLSQKAVDAYRRENPGSKLQTAVTEKKPKGKRAKRRANFCRRMRGMKDKLTSAKTARDPDSRINKALRRWNCN